MTFIILYLICAVISSAWRCRQQPEYNPADWPEHKPTD